MSTRKPDLSSAKSAEAAFYAAFNDCDPEAMAAVWADEGVICIHPGAPAVMGREAVLRSWSNILTDAARPSLRVVLLNRIEHGDLAVHLVEEHIASADDATPAFLVLATNVYRGGEDGWRLVGHHASIPATTHQASLQ